MPRERSPAEVQAEARSEEAILPAWDRGANPRPLEPDTSVERRVINDDYWVHQRVNRLRGASLAAVTISACGRDGHEAPIEPQYPAGRLLERRVDAGQGVGNQREQGAGDHVGSSESLTL